MDDSRRVLLRTHLQAVVPLRMAELSASTDAELLVAMEHIWPHDPDGRREPWVGAADALMYAPPGPLVTESLRRLVTGLALMGLLAEDHLMSTTDHTSDPMADRWEALTQAIGAERDAHRERAEHAEARVTAAEVASRGYRERAEKAEAERDAYKRAKAENDERFMVERDEARAGRDALRRAVEHFTAQRAELRGLLAALADRLDDFAHDELSALIEDEPLDHWGERYVSERDALAARIERVRALHVADEVDTLTGDCAAEECSHEDECPTAPVKVCRECFQIGEAAHQYAYEAGGLEVALCPCATVRALDGDGGE